MAYPSWLDGWWYFHSSRIRRLFQTRLYTTIEHSSPLALSYAYTGVLGPDEALWSSAALLPVFAGLGVGRMLRRHIEPALFRRVLLFVLILLGINLIRRGLYG